MPKSYQELKQQSREERDKDYKRRKDRALREGTLSLFVTCPLCGVNRPLQRWGKNLEFIVKPTYFLIQGRCSHGKGSGFFLSPKDSLKIKEVKKKYPELYENLKESIQELNELFK